MAASRVLKHVAAEKERSRAEDMLRVCGTCGGFNHVLEFGNEFGFSSEKDNLFHTSFM